MEYTVHLQGQFEQEQAAKSFYNMPREAIQNYNRLEIIQDHIYSKGIIHVHTWQVRKCNIH